MTSKKRLYRCSPFINGSAYCGMMRENDHGSFGPEFVGPGPYYVAEEADAEIERLTAQVNDAMQGEADATEAYRAQIERLRAALERAGGKFSRICQQAPADSAQHKPGDVWHIASDGEEDCAEALRGGVETIAEQEACEHLRSELLARKGDAFEMRKCRDCGQTFRVRLSVKTT